ncbi:GNAT family N-acetyltransferase [Haloarcula litorea]|uniref:GNAT family N-acetyltransferase n=1 Tax=Haloarcula litorea TaxID=3032579 RepID=UPI0023E8DC06|nr:GNAT family protein [Halomicroarcula sp. GDY20]
MPDPAFLEGDSVALHPMTDEDVGLAVRLRNDPRVRTGVGGSEPTTPADVEARRESRDDPAFVIRVDGEPVGNCVLHEDDHPWGYGEVGYAVLPDHWGNGYATDAVDCLARYAFTERRLHKLGADVYASNPASARVLEKVGFRREGRRRAHAFVDGEHVDLLSFGLLAEEWRSE